MASFWILLAIMVQSASFADAQDEAACMEALMSFIGPQEGDDPCMDMANPDGIDMNYWCDAARPCRPIIETMGATCEGNAMLPPEDYEGLKGLPEMCDHTCSMTMMNALTLGCKCDVAKLAGGRRLAAHNTGVDPCADFPVADIDACDADCEPKLCQVVKDCASETYDTMPSAMKTGMPQSDFDVIIPGINAATTECVCIPPDETSSAFTLHLCIAALFAAFMALAF